MSGPPFLQSGSLLGAILPAVGAGDADLGGAKDRVFARPLLAGVVPLGQGDGLRQGEEGDDVDDGHQSHEDVGQVPDSGKVGLGAEEDGGHRHPAKGGEEGLVVPDEEEVPLI